MDPKARTAPSGQTVDGCAEPAYTWTSEAKADVLMVDLTGFKEDMEFKKEHLKVRVDNHGNLRVSGQRPLDDNKWQTFNKVWRISEDCYLPDIKAKYENRVLSVVMPKLHKANPSSSSSPPAAAVTTVPPAKAVPSPQDSPPSANVTIRWVMGVAALAVVSVAAGVVLGFYLFKALERDPAWAIRTN